VSHAAHSRHGSAFHHCTRLLGYAVGREAEIREEFFPGTVLDKRIGDAQPDGPDSGEVLI